MAARRAQQTAETLSNHFVKYLVEKYPGSRHVRRVASWVGFLLKAVERVSGGEMRLNRVSRTRRGRQILFSYGERQFKVRYDHKVGRRGGIEIVEFDPKRRGADVAQVVAIPSLDEAERAYLGLRYYLDAYVDSRS